VLPVQPESVLEEFFVGHLGLRLQVGTLDHVGRGTEPSHADIMSLRLVPVKSFFLWGRFSSLLDESRLRCRHL
jgi:hypothetical protein